MLHLLILAVTISTVLGQELKECAEGTSAIKLSNGHIEPYPPKIPGMVKVSMDIEILKPLDNFDVNITIIKDLNGFPFKIPCLENLGSCYYENVCPILDQLFPDGHCPDVVTQCRCPFKTNKVQIKGLELMLPELPAEIAPIIPGKYSLYMSLLDNASKNVLSCHNLQFQLEDGHLYFD